MGKALGEPSELLKDFKVLESAGLKALHNYVATLAGAHQRSVENESSVSVHLRHVVLGKLQIGLGYYSTPVTINIPPNPHGMFYVQIPLTARLTLRVDGQEFTAGPDSGVVISPAVPTRRTSSPGWTLSFALPATFVRWRLAVHGGFLPVGDLVFDPSLQEPGLAIRSYCLFLVDVIDRGMVKPADPVAEVLVRGLVDMLVERQPHSHKQAVHANLSANQWERLMALEDFLERNFKEEIGVGDLAQAAGCSVRSVQACVAAYWNCTPTSLIRQRRLREARMLLQSGDSSLSVSTVAHEVGISHIGRFSQMYRDCYGESPAETLKRTRLRKRK